MDESLQKVNAENRLAAWVQRVSECRTSGLSRNEWCRQNNIPPTTYSYWQRKVYEYVKSQQESKFVEVPAVSSSSRISISCGDIKVDIADSSDVSVIRNIIKALKSC